MSDGRARRKGPEAGCLSIETSQRFDGEQMAELVIEYPFKFRPNPCSSISAIFAAGRLKCSDVVGFKPFMVVMGTELQGAEAKCHAVQSGSVR